MFHYIRSNAITGGGCHHHLVNSWPYKGWLSGLVRISRINLNGLDQDGLAGILFLRLDWNLLVGN